MARRYAETGTENAAAALQSCLNVQGTAAIRPEIYDIMVGQDGSPPADNAVVWDLSRFTVAPTDTGVVPVALDPTDPAATAVAGENGGTTGTFTAATEFIDLPVNQRASYRWVAAPGGHIICPASTSDGVGMRVSSPAYTGTAKCSFHHVE